MPDTTELYLKQNIQIEPLINHWYAWFYLYVPTTCAMIMANVHTKLLGSYLTNPSLHEAAPKQPELIGGPYVNLASQTLPAVEDFLDYSLEHCAELYELADAIENLNALLLSEAKGFSLAELYPQIPPCLRGYIELTYDLNNQPSFRFIEALIYHSNFFRKDLQSVGLCIQNHDERKFCLTTPRLDQNFHAIINLPFDHVFYDKLFAMKRNPTNYHEIDVLLTSAIDKQPICKEEIYELFTTTPPKKRLALPEKTVRIRYFGHACILIETLDCSILIDAAISYKYPGEISRYTYEDLPENIDYLLITHAHQDHVLLEHLIQLRHCINTVIVPKSGNGELQDPSLMLFFKQLAFNKVLEIDEMGVFSIPNGKVTGIPFLGEHSDLNIRSKTAYLIEIFGHKILAAADSNNIEPEMYKHIHQITGDIETIFLGMECDGAPMNWLYGGLFSKPVPHEQNQSRRLNGSDYESAISILKTFNCRQAYVYAMGQEPWLSYIMGMHCHENAKPITESNKLINYCAENGIVAERLFGEKEIII